ncbi:LPS-assembly protein LptD [Anaerovibrio lipolyticus]|uniref:LptA/OstA family protein n=1 Tax=Anaerovibrio lipolyticus TaxID=82374 RepID=UPI001F3184DC|nr:LptA/OstA family protein [Anaerovibrio lipolyticus]MCF2601321.1 LPS-assembly protein LptD [Anaerovibrio lipolyticus]
MFYKRTLAKALAMAALSGIIATGTIFAAGEPTSLDADSVEYDMATGVVTATGDVLMVQGDLKVTGQQAQYNSKTKEGSVEGNVIAVQSAKNMRVTAQKVTSDAQQHMVATGNVYGTMEDKTFSGPIVEYFQPQDYVLIRQGGTITSKDGVFTADEMEGYLKEEHLIGRGNVHVVSQPNDMEAVGDLLNYYGLEQGKAVLTGNAWAVQYNNTLKSNQLTILLAKDGQAKVTE